MHKTARYILQLVAQSQLCCWHLGAFVDKNAVTVGKPIMTYEACITLLYLSVCNIIFVEKKMSLHWYHQKCKFHLNLILAPHRQVYSECLCPNQTRANHTNPPKRHQVNKRICSPQVPTLLLVPRIPLLSRARLALHLDCPTEAAATLIVVLTIFVADLTARLAAAVLPSLLEARVQICADDTLVQLGAANVLHAVDRVLVGVVLDEAETAGRLVEAVQAHHKALDLATL